MLTRLLNFLLSLFSKPSEPLQEPLTPVIVPKLPPEETLPVKPTIPTHTLMDLSKWQFDKRFEPKVQEWLYQCQLKGYDIKITQGRRTQAEQDALWAQGRTTPGNIVTWTKKSNHISGTACDYAFNGKNPYPSSDALYKGIADIAVELGLTAGYYFKKNIDRLHIEL